MPDTYQGALDNVETNEQHGEDETLMKDRIDEGLFIEPRSKAKMLSDEQDLGKNKGVHYRKCVLRVVQMMLRQNDACVDRKQAEDKLNVEEDRKKAPELIGGFLL